MRMLPLLLALACAPPDVDTGLPAFTFPGPAAGPGLRGPGGPARTFTTEELGIGCAPLLGGEKDYLHHNLVAPYRGHLVMPWSPEFGSGGLSFFDVTDPCDPVAEGHGWHERMRETHAMGFVHLPEGDPHAGDYVAVNGTLGIQIWDISDATAPEMLTYLELPNIFYPDAYARVVLSVFWQYPWLYVAAADNGLYVLDATDPAAPELVTVHGFDPVLRAAGVFVLGDLLMVHAGEQSRVVLLDVGNPTQPQPILGGDFQVTDGAGEPWEAYHANLTGDWALFARKQGGGGVIVMDISDPTDPKPLTDAIQTDGNGGYVFYDEGYLFEGESDFGRIYRWDHETDEISIVSTVDIPGDLDTLTPFGNVAIASVDDEAEEGVASMVFPWTEEPDSQAPQVLRVRPVDGATGVPLTARVGIGFNEFIDPGTVFPGSVRLTAEDGTAIDGWGSGQEGIASYAPKALLRPGTTYTVEVVAGGITDLNGNPVAVDHSTRFTTVDGP